METINDKRYKKGQLYTDHLLSAFPTYSSRQDFFKVPGKKVLHFEAVKKTE
jgi:hypothetical protein